MPEFPVVFDSKVRYTEPVREGFSFQMEEGGRLLRIECRKMEQGISFRDRKMSFRHPCPVYSRLFVFREGGATVRSVRGTKYLKPGGVYLLPSGMPFDVTYSPGVLVYFHLHFCDRAGRSIFSGEDSVISLRSPRLTESLIRASETRSAVAEQAGIFAVLAEILPERLPELREREKRSQEFIRMFEYLEARPPATVSVGELAELYGIEESALSKRFRRKMGYSLKSYLQERELMLAEDLLLYSDMKVSEVAEMLGHRDFRYFHRFFKRLAGMTPLEFRRGGGRGSG